MRDHVLATLTRSVPAAVAESALAYAAAERMDMAGCAARAAQLESGVAGGVLTPREASELISGQPECLRREFSVDESDALVCVCKPWDLRLRLDKAPQWEGEIGLDAWLADEHPSTCTPEGTAWLCHNLDFATSGIIVAAKSSAAAGEVSRCFREREADKLYAALVFGHPEWDERKIKAPIAVSQRRFKQRVAASGKSAETHAFVGARGTLRIQPHIGRDASLLWLAPKTGRRHQLRLHLSHVGHPIVGDATYASDKQCYRTFLHAAALRLPLQPPFEAAETYAPLAPRGWSDVFEPSSPLLSPPAWPDAGARLAGELT